VEVAENKVCKENGTPNRAALLWWEGVHPGGNADRFENKGLAGKAIRKTMKTKG
jgi:hypothetical protein